MALASLGALAAFYASIAVVRTAPAATVWVETWRMFGFVVFAGIFGLLAMSVSALVLTGASGAAAAGSIDAVLALLLAAAYVCTRAWTAWRVQDTGDAT